MSEKKKTPPDDVPGYERVKKILLDKVASYPPSGQMDLPKQTFRLACGPRELGKHCFLLVNVEAPHTMLFIEGDTQGMSGCVDGLNIYPRSSPIVSMMRDLEVITPQDADAFRREVRRRSQAAAEETEVELLRQKACKLGYDVIPKKKP